MPSLKLLGMGTETWLRTKPEKISRDKRSSLPHSAVSDEEEKSFITLTPALCPIHSR
jgi:hypothetical protein